MNTLKNVSFCCAVAMVMAVASTTQAALLSHWTFDSDASDSGPAGQNGTLVGTAAITATDVVAGGGALLLDGSGAVDISQANTSLHGLTTSTISAWVRVDAFTVNQIGDVPNVFTRDLTPATIDNTNRMDVGIDFRPGAPATWRGFGLDAGGNAAGGINNSVSTPFDADSVWHHVAVVFDASAADQVLVYTDGALDDATIITALTETDFDFAAIGGFTVSGTAPHIRNNLVGAIDDMQIYSHAVSAAGVKFLFDNPGSTVPEPASLALLGLGVLAMLGFRRR